MDLLSIEREVELFLKEGQYLISRGDDLGIAGESPLPGVFIYRPNKIATEAKKEHRPIGLTLMALTHGNEVGGVSVLREILSKIEKKEIILKDTLALALGNIEAALKGKRFLEKDLNRCYQIHHQGPPRDLESKRALALGSLLDQSAYLLDLHQTQTPTKGPFYILHYSQKGEEFLKAHQKVLHPVLGFPLSARRDKDLTTTLYVNHRGGGALTLELGEKGWSEEQKNIGVKACLEALNALLTLRGMGAVSLPVENEAELYSVVERIPCPEGDGDLVQGLANFSAVKKGDLLGHFSGGGDIYSPLTGFTIFPKFQQGPDRVQTAFGEPLCLLAQKASWKQIRG